MSPVIEKFGLRLFGSGRGHGPQEPRKKSAKKALEE